MVQSRSNPLKEKSYAFAVTIIKLCQDLSGNRKEFILSKQILRSGTSIGSAVEEANQGESRADFIHKLAIANKEAHETRYWLRLLRDTGYIDTVTFEQCINDCEEIIKLLIAIINSSKRKEG